MAMIASAHVAAGAVVGMASAYAVKHRFARLALATGMAVVVHFLMDAIPHSDYAALPRPIVLVVATCEILAASAIAWCVLRTRLTSDWPVYMSAGLLGSLLPDIKFAAPLLLPGHVARLVEQFGDRLHEPFHASASSLAAGMAAQFFCTALLLALLTLFPRTPGHRASSPRTP